MLDFALKLLVMAGITYLLRAVPLVLVKNKMENRFIRSFLYYVPYAVLGVMTFPEVLYATSTTGTVSISALVGTLVACVLAYFEKSLLTVAISSSAVVLAIELITMIK